MFLLCLFWAESYAGRPWGGGNKYILSWRKRYYSAIKRYKLVIVAQHRCVSKTCWPREARQQRGPAVQSHSWNSTTGKLSYCDRGNPRLSWAGAGGPLTARGMRGHLLRRWVGVLNLEGGGSYMGISTCQNPWNCTLKTGASYWGKLYLNEVNLKNPHSG